MSKNIICQMQYIQGEEEREGKGPRDTELDICDCENNVYLVIIFTTKNLGISIIQSRWHF